MLWNTKIGFFIEYSYLCNDVKFADMKIRMLITALLAVFLTVGCADIKRLEDMKIDSVTVENLSPVGLRGLDLTLALNVDNPGAQVSLSEISALLEHSGKVLGKVAVDPFILQGKTAGTYHLKAGITLSEDATILDLAKLLDKKVLDEMLVDLSAVVRLRKGPSRKMEMNDIPLKKLIETVK